MNKRIQELAEQTNAWFPNGYPSGEGGDAEWKNLVIFEKQDLQKFAQLIVKECADFIEQDQGSGNALANRLNQHFGVSPEKEAIPLDEKKGHLCPYNMEINDDYQTLCDCDEEATEQCALDV